MIRSLFLISVPIVLAACSTHPAAIRISDSPAAGASFDGVPMRVKTEQTVQLWRLNPETDEYEKVSETRQVLADQQRLYAVDVVSGPFASPTLHVTEYPDNTPSSVEAAGTENTSGAIDAATGVVSGLSTARNANVTACQTARAAVVTQDQAIATARASYDALPATATPELRAAYQAVIDKAQAAAAYAAKNPQC